MTEDEILMLSKSKISGELGSRAHSIRQEGKTKNETREGFQKRD